MSGVSIRPDIALLDRRERRQNPAIWLAA